MEKYRDKEWLKEQYLEKEKSMREIAKNEDFTRGAVVNWLDKFEIETRNPGNRTEYHIKLTFFGQQFLDGLMLGDGSLNSKQKSAYYIHGDSYWGYLQWLSERLSEIGLENQTEKRVDRVDEVRTKSYRELKDWYDEWYPDGGDKSRIPEWVEVTPITLFNWFIGDGSYYPIRKNCWQLKIASTTFGDDLLKMVEQIKNLDISCTKVVDGINFHEPHEDFFDYILSSGIEIPPGYEYKFPDEIITGGID